MAYLSLQQHINYPEYEELIKVLKERDKKKKAEAWSIITINGGVSLPEELIIEILSWLPVKTLLQFKSVCKSWYNIIVSRNFISKHLVNYYDNNHDMDCLLTLQLITQAGEVDFRARFVDETLGIYSNAELHKAPLRHFEICGPCNGIYYLSAYYDRSRLWNPTINDLKVLPPLIMKPGLPDYLTYDCYEAYGFGYDPVGEDYKVVIIKEYESKCDSLSLGEHQRYQYPPSVLVYSLKTDSWKYWGDLPQFYDRLQNNESHIFVNGCLYWVGVRYDDEFKAIISFNIVTNVLQEMPNCDRESSTSLGIYKDSVAFYAANGRYYEGDEFFDVWTFNEGCWTKKISIGLFGRILYPIGHLKNNIVVLVYGGDLVLCDPDTEEMRAITLSTGGFRSVVVYMESLVSLSTA